METNEMLTRLEELIKKNCKVDKAFLTLDEATEYLGYSKSYLYKLTSKKRIPHYKPSSKKIYFVKKEIDNWIINSKVSEAPSYEAIAEEYCQKRRKR